MIQNQTIIPAITSHQALKKFLKTNHEYGILMNFQIAQVKDLIEVMKQHNRKVIIHLELIKGVSNDEYGAIYLIQEHKVDGIITTKPRVIDLCKKRNVVGIMRFFLKDSVSLKQSIELVKRVNPDSLEVLPAMPEAVSFLKGYIGCPIYMGGLIQDHAHIERCLKYGAKAITVSNDELW